MVNIPFPVKHESAFYRKERTTTALSILFKMVVEFTPKRLDSCEIYKVLDEIENEFQIIIE